MATREITHNSIEFAGKNEQYAEITSLRASIQSGGLIYANDMNRIANLINNMNGHYHNYTDMYQTATYGNNGDRGTYTEGKNTNSIDAANYVGNGTAAGTDVSAARHNELRDAVNQLRVHYHGIDDRTA